MHSAIEKVKKEREAFEEQVDFLDSHYRKKLADQEKII